MTDYTWLVENLRGEFPQEYVKEAARAIEELMAEVKKLEHYALQCDNYFDDMPYDPREDFEDGA